MPKMIRDEAPSPLEALRPVMECDTADLLRFLNFMSALEKWYHLKCNYEHAGPKSVEVNFREERALIRRWAVQDEPYKHGKPITVTTLARKAKVSRRTLTHYLTKANEENPTVFAMLKKYRLQRFRKAGRYEI